MGLLKRRLGFITALIAGCPVYSASFVPADMLEAHNAWRTLVGVPPMVWSDELQASAQKWAETLKEERNCQMKHSGSGENLYWASPRQFANSKDAQGNWIWQNSLQTVDDKRVVDAWGNEKQWYNYADNSCNAPAGKSCGHYTQIVWRDTQTVGCANAICDDFSQVWVCHYNPPGNYIGRKPY